MKNFVEIGAGSGHNIAAAEKEFPGLERLIATDVNPYALPAIMGNAERNNPQTKLECYLGTGIPDVEGGYDVILCNPPYIPTLPEDGRTTGDFYRGTDLIKTVINIGLPKLNQKNNDAMILISFSSVAINDFVKYCNEENVNLTDETRDALTSTYPDLKGKIINHPSPSGIADIFERTSNVPLKVDYLGKEWKEYLVKEQHLKENPGEGQPYLHDVLTFAIKTPVVGRVSR